MEYSLICEHQYPLPSTLSTALTSILGRLIPATDLVERYAFSIVTTMTQPLHLQAFQFDLQKHVLPISTVIPQYRIMAFFVLHTSAVL